MVFLKKTCELIVFSNIWIALSAAGLTLNTYLLLNLKTDWNVISLVFLATFSVYNFQRLIKHYFQKKNHTKRHLWIYNHIKSLTILVAISSLFSIFLFFKSYSLTNFIFLLPFTITSLLYASSIFSKKRALRDFPLIKIFLIAITWGASSVILPFIKLNNDLDIKVIMVFIFNLLFIIAIAIPFDIRDLKLDDIKTKTIPQLVGIKKAVYLSLLLIIICFTISCLYLDSIGQLLSLSITFIALLYSRKEMPELYFSGILDGTILLFPIFNLFF